MPGILLTPAEKLKLEKTDSEQSQVKEKSKSEYRETCESYEALLVSVLWMQSKWAKM